MASISGVSSSNMTSSLYNSGNIISGLASGLDTEGMIENLVKGYQTKIQNLNNQVTKITWKQESYRSIIAKMNVFANKYTSYTSSTNLMSASFFNNAIKVASQGQYASAVSASGRTDSNISVTSVKQLATAASLSTQGNLETNKDFAVTGAMIDLGTDYSEGALSGSISLAYGGKTISVTFNPSTDKIQDYETNEDGSFKLDEDGKKIERSAEEKAQDLVNLINKKLADTQVSLSSGEAKAASDLISVTTGGDGRIAIADKSSGGNSVYISGTSGNVGSVLGLNLGSKPSESKVAVIDMHQAGDLMKTQDRADYISGKTMNVSLDGNSKQITLPTLGKDADNNRVFLDKDGNTIKDDNGNALAVNGANYAKLVNDALANEFGANKITVTAEAGGTDDQFSLKFKTRDNSTLIINSDAGDALGIGNIATNYLNTSNSLDTLMGDKINWDNMETVKNADGSEKLDAAGNKLYAFTINGVKIGEYNKDTSLSTIMSDINANSEAGVKVSYSQTSQKFSFTAKETGEQGRIEFGDDLAQQIFGTKEQGKFTEGKDAIFSVNVNGDELVMQRSSNTTTIDGMSLTLKGTFNPERVDEDSQGKLKIADGQLPLSQLSSDSVVSFQSSCDTDTVISAIRDMINDYNAMMTEIRGQFTTMPNQTSTGDSYEPLSDEDMATMSESAIQSYEAKAKAGILFGDTNLRGLYDAMQEVFQRTGADAALLSKIGITTSFASDSTATVVLDENKLREALENDPDEVAEIFTRSSSNGASSNGVMQSLKGTLDKYASTTGSFKGILVEQAGTELSSLTLMSNAWQQQIDSLNEQITSWQDKLSAQVDKYTSLFSRMEVLISQMNSQSSTLAGLMGG